MDRTLMLVMIDALKAQQALNDSEDSDDYVARSQLREEARVLVRAALRLAHQCGELPHESDADANLKAVA